MMNGDQLPHLARAARVTIGTADDHVRFHGQPGQVAGGGRQMDPGVGA